MTPERVERVVAADLRDGDVFEYEFQRWPDRPAVLRRDTVRARRYRWEPEAVAVRTTETAAPGWGLAEGDVWITTEVGQTNHGWVVLPARAVVLRVTPET